MLLPDGLRTRGGHDHIGGVGYGARPFGRARAADARGGARSGERRVGWPQAGMGPEEVVSFLAGPAVRAVYEAGPTGFGLARAARERGIELRVAAPRSIPRRAGDRVKTDRRDAARLVRLLAAGELSFAFVPS